MAPDTAPIQVSEEIQDEAMMDVETSKTENESQREDQQQRLLSPHPAPEPPEAPLRKVSAWREFQKILAQAEDIGRNEQRIRVSTRRQGATDTIMQQQQQQQNTTVSLPSIASELTAKEEAQVARLFDERLRQDKVMATWNKIDVTRADILLLNNEHWINDQVSFDV